MPTNETIIPFSKSRLTKLLLLFAACILTGSFGIFAQMHKSGVYLTLPGFAVLIVFLLFFGFLLGTLHFRQLLKNGPGLIIDNSGFTDYSSGLAAGYVPWTEVKAIKTVTVTKHKRRVIAVILKNPHAYLERQPNALKRKAMTMHLRNYGTPVRLTVDSLQCSFEELRLHLQSYFDRSRPYVLN